MLPHLLACPCHEVNSEGAAHPNGDVCAQGPVRNSLQTNAGWTVYSDGSWRPSAPIKSPVLCLPRPIPWVLVCPLLSLPRFLGPQLCLEGLTEASQALRSIYELHKPFFLALTASHSLMQRPQLRWDEEEGEGATGVWVKGAQ